MRVSSGLGFLLRPKDEPPGALHLPLRKDFGPSLLSPLDHGRGTPRGQVEMTFKTELIFLIVIVATLVVARMLEGITL
jgi:hypothetical protein